MTLIGPIINGRHVEEALIATLKPYLGDPEGSGTGVYLAEIAADAGLPRSTYKVASYARAATADIRFPEEALPCVVVRCSGKTNLATHSDGTVPAAFQATVGVVICDQERDLSADIAWDYIAAIEAILVQHPALNGLAAGLDLGNSTQNDVSLTETRTLAGGTVDVTVLVDEALNALGGPLTPPDDPTEELPDDPTVATVDVTAQPQ